MVRIKKTPFLIMSLKVSVKWTENQPQRDYLPDEKLIREWERQRGKGRDGYPIRAVWNAVLASVVFQHKSIA
jgi:hypothetical protein